MKNKLKLIISLVCACLFMGNPLEGESVIDSDGVPGEINFGLIQPFSIFYNHYDLHVMLYLKGHPEYEAVEALIKYRNREKPLIQAIVTRHDQTQIDYINDPELPRLRQNFLSNRPIYYTPIEFSHGEGRVSLKFSTHKGESIVFDLHTVGKPTSTFAGLIDPEGHARESALPVMWSALNTLASTESSIAIDGKLYTIPAKIKIPFFFTGLKGYYSEGFSIGVIYAAESKLEMVKTLKEIATGQVWLIKKGSLESVYEINEFDGNCFTVTNQNKLERIEGMVAGNQILIKSIETMASPESNESMTLRFAPALPEASGMLEGERVVSDFQIDINQQPGLIQGIIEMKKTRGQVSIDLRPAKPKWAVKRGLRVTIDPEVRNIFRIQASITQ